MNPAPINTINVQQFGFKSIFDLETAKLTLDISSLTIFKPGGETAIIGINFEVIDPSGIALSSIDFPNVDIDPGTGQTTYDVQLTNSVSQYGWYFIKGVLREANGNDYSVEVKANICQPNGIKKGVVEGKLESNADCTIPRILITEVTNMAYLKKDPVEVIKSGMFYYPHGTLANVAFTYTPFQVVGSGKVYTGDYQVRNKSVALYEFNDYVIVKIAYGSTLKFTVNCTSNVCDILCCLEKYQSVAETDCDGPAGRDAKQKLQSVVVPLTMAIAMEKCGKNAGDIYEEIAKKLNCACSCDDSQIVEARPIITSFDPISFIGECATTAIYDADEQVWKIKTKNVTVTKGDVGDQAIKIVQTSNDCAINFAITLDKNILAGDILNEISNSAELKNIFNSLIVESGIDFSALDGKCIFDTSSCQFNLIEDASNASKLVTSVVVNGTVYNAPSGLGITNALGIKNWLDSLSLGPWNVYYDSSTTPKTTVFGFATAEHLVSIMSFSLAGNQVVHQFSKNCGGLIEILQAIFDYVCGLDDTQIRLSQSYSICFVDNTGQIQTTTVSTLNNQGQPNSVNTFMAKLLETICVSFTNLRALVQVNCAALKAIFIASDNIQVTDTIYGTRNNKCGAWSIADLTKQLINYLYTTNDTELMQQFCELRNRCVVPVCNPVTFIEVELIEACPGVTTIQGQFTN